MLCLHGYLQDAKVFSSRLGHLRKTNPFKREVTFTFLDAPFEVLADEDDDTQHRQVLSEDLGDDAGVSIGRSWWQFSSSSSSPSSSSARPSQSFEYRGVEESVVRIRNAIEEHHIDTLMGFSQGAAMAAYFAATQDVAGLGIKRLLTYAGFLPKDPKVAEKMLVRAPIPSSVLRTMIVAGTSDELISVERSRTLLDVFEDARLVEHDGGHYVPTTKGAMKDHLVEFLLAGRG